MKSRSSWTLREGQSLRIGDEVLRVVKVGDGMVDVVKNHFDDPESVPWQIQLGAEAISIGDVQVTAKLEDSGRRAVRLTVVHEIPVHLV